jgi:amino acid transporter
MGNGTSFCTTECERQWRSTLTPKNPRIILAASGPCRQPNGRLRSIAGSILRSARVELAAALGEETANPTRSIPREVLTTILLVAGFYVLTQWVGTVGFASISDWAEGGYGTLAEGRGYRGLAVLIELAVLLDLLAIGMGMTVATARGLFTLARDSMVPERLAATNGRSIPDVATFQQRP